jgi:hypothetical protein
VTYKGIVKGKTIEFEDPLALAIDQGKRPVRFAGIFDQEDQPR